MCDLPAPVLHAVVALRRNHASYGRQAADGLANGRRLVGLEEARSDIDVFADADDEHPVPRLGNAVFLRLDKEQLRIDLAVGELLLGK